VAWTAWAGAKTVWPGHYSQSFTIILIMVHSLSISEGSGSKIFDPNWVGLGWVSHLWFGVGFEKFSLKIPIFWIFFSSGQKKSLLVRPKSTRVEGGSGSYLLRVKSMRGSGQCPSSNNPRDSSWIHFTSNYCDVFPHKILKFYSHI